jgi:uncharacterized membrane protein
MTGLALFISVFLACAVEAVEATTIVLAAGTARDWKSSLMGTGSALGVLAIVIGAFGPSISHLPINSLRLFVGGLLLVFGLQWVRKAILRASGYKALHDEDAIFQEEIAAARKANEGKKFGVHDWYSFTLSFKGVLLEGLEVAFIVITFGTIQHRVGLASLAALAAVLIVVVAGAALRKPLARVPENQMKFVVGIMLTSFGIFWGAEGAGAHWPHSDLSLLGIIPFMAALSFILITILKNQKARKSLRASSLAGAKSSITNVEDFDEADAEAIIEDRGFLKAIKDFGYFWYDFLIGDDLIGTLIVLASFEITNLAFHSGTNGWWILPLGVSLLLPINLLRVTR